MVEAVESAPGTDPDRASFTITLETARNQTIIGHAAIDDTNNTAVGAIGRAVLAALLPRRRQRTSSRKVKAPVSRYAAHQHGKRPSNSQNITALTIDIHNAAQTPPAIPIPSDRRSINTGPGRTGDGARNQTLQLQRTQPERHWHASEITQALGYANIKSLRTGLGRWATEGLLHKIRNGVYTLATPNPQHP